MSGDLFEDARERAGLDRMVVRNYLVVLPIPLRGHADVGALLPGRFVSQDAKRFHKSHAIYITR